MKKLFAVLPAIIFLMSVALVSASLNIIETNINATTDPGNVLSKQINLSNTEHNDIFVNFTGLDLVCAGNPSKTITASVSNQTVPANSTVPVSVLFSIPARQFACTYNGRIVASSGSLADSVTVNITVNAVPDVSVNNRTITILKNLSTISNLNVAVTNTGNTPLNIIYQYSNFSYLGNVLAIGSAGSDVIQPDETHYISILIATDNSLPDGNYVSTLKLNGTVNKAYQLTATLKTPLLSVNLPDFTMPETERNKTSTKTFTIKNDGDYPLEGISLTTDADTKYNVVISGVPDSLASGESATVTISAFVPENEKTTIHSIGNIIFASDKLTKPVPLNLNVLSKLKIEEVTVKIDDSSKPIDSNGEEIDYKDTHPGSRFDVSVKICNKYDNNDFTISGITGTLTFENVDNGDDIDGEISEFDLNGDECKKVSATFDKNQISYLTDEGTYKLVIEIEGDDDEYDVTQADKWTIPIKVYREDSTKILFDDVSLSPSTANCGGTTDLKVVAYNIGGTDSQAKLRIYNADLGIDINKFFKIGDKTDEDCDAIDEPDEKCIGIDHIFTINIPSSVQSGSYPIDIIAFKDETKQTDKKTVNLVVNCGTTGTEGTGTSGTTGGTSGGTGGTGGTTGTGGTGTSGAGNVVITPSASTSSRIAGTPVKIKDVSETSNLWLVGLIAGNVLLVIIIILVVVAVLKSKP